jgi:hypothetical protein
VHLGDDRGRGLDAPAHGLEDQLQLGRGQLGAGLLQRGVDAVAEEVVVFEEAVAQRFAQDRGHLDQAAVALPGRGVEQLLALLLGQALLRRAALVIVGLFVVATPVGQALLQRGRDGAEVVEEVVAEFVIQHGAQVFVTRGEAQRLDGLQRQAGCAGAAAARR